MVYEELRERKNQDWFEKINSQGIEVVGIIARYFEYDQAWLEHIVMEHMTKPDGCKCKLGHERELVESCPKWLAVKRYKDAEESLTRAKRDLESASSNLDNYV